MKRKEGGEWSPRLRRKEHFQGVVNVLHSVTMSDVIRQGPERISPKKREMLFQKRVSESGIFGPWQRKKMGKQETEFVSKTVEKTGKIHRKGEKVTSPRCAVHKTKNGKKTNPPREGKRRKSEGVMTCF